MALIDTSINSLNSARHKDLMNSINSVESNKILLDNISNWYLFEGQIILGFNILKKYENIFKTDLIDYSLPKEYHYRPEYVCQELYNTPDLWYLLLFVNDMAVIDDFTRETIKVFDANRIEVINEIINNEIDFISTKEEPRYIRKHFLKNLNEPSKNILDEDYYNETKFLKSYSSDNRVKDFLNYIYHMSDTTIEKGKILDNNNLEITPFELMQNIYNIPSCYYKDGYKNTYRGKIYLDNTKDYNILKLYNGNIEFVLKDADGNKVERVSSDFDFGQYVLINDLRSANLSVNKIDSNEKCNVTFQEKNGRYSLNCNSILDKGKYTLYEYTISKDDLQRINLDRLKNNGYVFIDFIYSSSYSSNNVKFTGYSVKVNYTNGDSEIYECESSNSSYYNTNNLISELKLAINFEESESIDSIVIYSDVEILKNKTPFNFNLFAIKMNKYLIEDILIPFSVPNAGIYDFELTYNYSENFKGIYFEPKILERYKDGSNTNYKEHMDSFYYYSFNNYVNTVIPNETDKGFININTQVNGGWRTKKWIDVHSTNLSLPSEYVLVFNTFNASGQTSGSIMFVFDSPNTEEGYALVISGSTDNKYLPKFNRDGKYVIAKTGFYKLTKEKDSKNYYIFDGDKFLYFKAKLVKELSNSKINGKNLKLIKKYNKIRLYEKVNDKFDFKNPIVSFDDNDYFFINGGIRIAGLFMGGAVHLKEFYPYE